MLPDVRTTCLQHLAFMRWADERMLGAVAENMPDQISVLSHIYLAEAVWLGRVKGQADLMITQLPAPPNMPELQRVWPTLHQEWLDWANDLAAWDTLVPHRNLQGALFQMPAWQIVLHLVNHGSFHRGQVAAMLRAAGFTPPATDLIVYYRLQS